MWAREGRSESVRRTGATGRPDVYLSGRPSDAGRGAIRRLMERRYVSPSDQLPSSRLYPLSAASRSAIASSRLSARRGTRQESSTKPRLPPQSTQRLLLLRATKRRGRRRPTAIGSTASSPHPIHAGSLPCRMPATPRATAMTTLCMTYAERSDRDTIIGYCFYHGQDLDRAVQGQGRVRSDGCTKRTDGRAVHRGHDRR
jgi:hypothetical protein